MKREFARRLDVDGVHVEPGPGGEAAAPAIGRRPTSRRGWPDRLMPLGDLALAALVLGLWSLPVATTVAFASAVVVGILVSPTPPPTVCGGVTEKALRVTGRTTTMLLAALPIAWVDGAFWSATVAALALLGFVFTFRLVVGKLTWRQPSRAQRVAIVGTGPLGLEVAEYFLDHHEVGVEPVGFIDRQVRGEVSLPILGEPDDLDRVVVDHGIDSLVVAYGAFSEEEIVPKLRECEGLPLEVVVLPRFFELSFADLDHELWGFPVTRIQRPAAERASWRLKRLVDVVGASLLLVVFSPVMLAVAAAVKLTSRGPVMFKQERVGHRGRVFEMLKFRSMLENDDSDTTWSVEFDTRVTPIGRVIRVTHLDELPQLINVLKGDMSLVGPRPERPYFVKLFSSKYDNYEHRHRVPGGITGWSQVNGLWGDTSMEARSRHDNRYIESWSLKRDLLILVKTIPTVFKRRS